MKVCPFRNGMDKNSSTFCKRKQTLAYLFTVYESPHADQLPSCLWLSFCAVEFIYLFIHNVFQGATVYLALEILLSIRETLSVAWERDTAMFSVKENCNKMCVCTVIRIVYVTCLSLLDWLWASFSGWIHLRNYLSQVPMKALRISL